MTRTSRADAALDQARQAADRIKPVADQLKPLAESTKAAADRGLRKTRAWAAPQLERTGQALQDKVAPKVSAMLSSAAGRIEPGRERRRLPAGAMIGAAIAAIAAGVAAAAAALRRGRDRHDPDRPGGH